VHQPEQVPDLSNCTAASRDSAVSAGSVPQPAEAGTDGPGDLLKALSSELLTRGLAVNVFQFDRLLSLIEVSNPTDPGRGTVSIGRDGYLFGELHSPLSDHAAAGRATHTVVKVLGGDSACVKGSDIHG
jgi:hypothetical protein